MTTYNVQPLDSFRLGAYQLPIPCYLCNSSNLFDAKWCRNCRAPMEMMRVAASEKTRTRPQIIPTLGASNVGKTVYLGMLLDVLARHREELDFTTCDAATVAMQQESISVLARGCFPPATHQEPENWHWAHCRLKRPVGKTALETFLLDISGTSLMNEIERHGGYPVVQGMLAKATGFLLLVDADRVHRGDKDEEFFALKILGHIQEIWERQHEAQQGSQKLKKRSLPTPLEFPPLAIIQMKADMCPECSDNPVEYARGQLPNLWQYCRDNFPNHHFFASSAVGACAMMPSGRAGFESVPLRVEPRGILEPFRWVFSQLTP